MQNNRIALVSGANKGIGYEIACKLGKEGITLYVGARDVDRGKKAAEQLTADGIDARAIHLDLNDQDSIRAAYTFLQDRHGVLDILVNNAGVIDTKDGAPGATVATVRNTFDTNFLGTFEVTQAMLPLLRLSTAGRIVNVSSGLGSLALNEDPDWAFASTKLIGCNASKAALTMLTVQLAWELRDTAIKVNSANPGYTDTDLVPGAVGGQPAEAGAREAIRLALLPADGPTGGFFENEGRLPW
jgi:NAD(P)-dependent dehydrogenase (short-subunit alcohol dehydrogenase family)